MVEIDRESIQWSKAYCWHTSGYGNTGCDVFKRGVTKLERFFA